MSGFRTLHLTSSWHEASGGIRTFYTALLAHANRTGRHLAVVAPGAKTALTEVGACGRLYTVAGMRSPIFDHRYRIILPHRFLPGPFGDVWRVIERESPDLIEVSDKYALCHVAGLVKRRAGSRPTVVGFSQERMDDALGAYISTRTAALATRYLAAVYMRQFDAHIANSEYTAEELRLAIFRTGPRRPKLWRLRDHVHVQPLGVDLETFSRARRDPAIRLSLLARAGGTSRSLLVLFAGRLAPEKNVQWLVPAIHCAVGDGIDARLVIAGDGPARSHIERDAADVIPGRVVTIGHQGDRARFASIVASADVFLHPNPREPFGIGPLEAMASGTPVVLPRAGGVLSYATDRNAWLAKPDAAGLGVALVGAIRHERERIQRAAEAVATAHAFAAPHMATRLFDLYYRIHRERLARQATAGTTPPDADDPRRATQPSDYRDWYLPR